MLKPADGKKMRFKILRNKVLPLIAADKKVKADKAAVKAAWPENGDALVELLGRLARQSALPHVGVMIVPTAAFLCKSWRSAQASMCISISVSELRACAISAAMLHLPLTCPALPSASFTGPSFVVAGDHIKYKKGVVLEPKKRKADADTSLQKESKKQKTGPKGNSAAAAVAEDKAYKVSCTAHPSASICLPAFQ